MVLISGEAGIGKSRLAAAVLERLATEPHTRLRYFCSPQHTDSALHPFIGQMERAAGLAYDDNPRAKLDKLDAVLGRTSTSTQDAAIFAEMLSLPNDGRYPALALTPEQRRQRTLEALTLQLEALTRQQPVLMIFEDVHWIDPTSLELLSRAVDRIATLRGLLIVTFRLEFEPPWIGRPHVMAMTVNRLARREIERGDRSRRRQQAAAGEHPAGHRRASRRHSALCRGNNQGSAELERGRSATDCRDCAAYGFGSPRSLACLCHGVSTASASPRKWHRSVRLSGANSLACTTGRGDPQGGSGTPEPGLLLLE